MNLFFKFFVILISQWVAGNQENSELQGIGFKRGEIAKPASLISELDHIELSNKSCTNLELQINPSAIAINHHNKKPVISLRVGKDSPNCIEIFKFATCEEMSIQFLNTTRKNLLLDSNDYFRTFSRILNFNISPKSAGICRLPEYLNETGLETWKELYCPASFYLLTLAYPEQPFHIWIKEGKCENIDKYLKPSFTLLFTRTNVSTPICIQLHSEYDCRDYGDVIRVMIPSCPTCPTESIIVWKYLKDTDIIIKSAGKCSPCLSLGEWTPSEDTFNNDGNSDDSETENCQFDGCLTINNLLDLSQRKNLSEMWNANCYLFFNDSKCATPPNIMADMMNYTDVKHIAKKYSNFLKWSVAKCTKNGHDNCKYLMEGMTLHDIFPTEEFESFQEKNITENNEQKNVEGDEYSKNVSISGAESNNYENSFDIRIIGPILGTAFGFLLGLTLLIIYRQCKRRLNKRCLTRKEVSEFYRGCVFLKENSTKTEGANDRVSLIEGTGYNKDFEVDKANFRLSDSQLGSGAFGEVWKGTVIKSGMEINVAAKMLKKGCPTTTLKSFLSEIKVMAYLGQHNNLVGIIGAYTKSLERGKVIIFTELCGKGSLENYLRDLDKALLSEGRLEIPERELAWLHRWCFEIANGMEYLTLKNVVHADLATRNVLLDDELQAKISDFGLSRRLYDYANYVKNQQEPLPWKWMAPEALKRLEFNEKTDVWAFGMTMWEIYSLGSIPYQGLNWTVNFSTQLVMGLREEKPLHDNCGMYTIMIRSWNVDPSKRPTFSELKTDIEKLRLKQNDRQIENEFQEKYENHLGEYK